jgi:S1-C subfamily serine protease
MKKILAFMCAMLLASCTVNLNVPGHSVNDRVLPDMTKIEKSVAMVYANAVGMKGRMSGTAFAIDEDYLITAGHVCSGIMEYQDQGILENTIRLQLVRDGQPIAEKDGAEVVDIDGVHDVCLLRKPNHGLKALEFVDNYNKDVDFKDPLWLVGYPYGINFSWQEGNVINANYKGELLISAAVAGGNSGGPVVNKDGKVVGIVVRGTEPYEHLAICVKASVVKKFIKIVGWKMEE